ncbi:hypothetical protein SNEBB_002380 [Seison nebaliae]|nr:hypothetical protein SNEBB_002380 [Seison nebaliae]
MNYQTTKSIDNKRTHTNVRQKDYQNAIDELVHRITSTSPQRYVTSTTPHKYLTSTHELPRVSLKKPVASTQRPTLRGGRSRNCSMIEQRSLPTTTSSSSHLALTRPSIPTGRTSPRPIIKSPSSTVRIRKPLVRNNEMSGNNNGGNKPVLSDQTTNFADVLDELTFRNWEKKRKFHRRSTLVADTIKKKFPHHFHHSSTSSTNSSSSSSGNTSDSDSTSSESSDKSKSLSITSYLSNDDEQQFRTSGESESYTSSDYETENEKTFSTESIHRAIESIKPKKDLHTNIEYSPDGKAIIKTNRSFFYAFPPILHKQLNDLSSKFKLNEKSLNNLRQFNTSPYLLNFNQTKQEKRIETVFADSSTESDLNESTVRGSVTTKKKKRSIRRRISEYQWKREYSSFELLKSKSLISISNLNLLSPTITTTSFKRSQSCELCLSIDDLILEDTSEISEIGEIDERIIIKKKSYKESNLVGKNQFQYSSSPEHPFSFKSSKLLGTRMAINKFSHALIKPFTSTDSFRFRNPLTSFGQSSIFQLT